MGNKYDGGKRIIVPLIYGEDMARKSFGGKSYDSSNIPGATLAKIGKMVLEDSSPPQSRKEVIGFHYAPLQWLDIRIEEVCERGRI